ncbi:formylglycine-generating enzyme family protein [Chloroflexota bacterium]
MIHKNGSCTIVIFFVLFLSGCSDPRVSPPTYIPNPTAAARKTLASSELDTKNPDIPFDIKDRNKDGMKMVYVPIERDNAAGTRSLQEDSIHIAGQPTIPLNPYWIDMYEVSNHQFSLCLSTGICKESDYIYDEKFKNGDLPAVAVTWNEAENYCHWVGGRLPTEVEWRFAAQGPEQRIYPWGNQFDGEKANFCDINCQFNFRHTGYDDGHNTTAPMGSYPDGASWVGAMDMAGNVREWVSDFYPTSYYTNPAQSDADLSEMDSYRGAWGGNWLNQSSDLRTDSSLIVLREYQSTYIGFRCVMDSNQ